MRAMCGRNQIRTKCCLKKIKAMGGLNRMMAMCRVMYGLFR